MFFLQFDDTITALPPKRIKSRPTNRMREKHKQTKPAARFQRLCTWSFTMRIQALYWKRKTKTNTKKRNERIVLMVGVCELSWVERRSRSRISTLVAPTCGRKFRPCVLLFFVLINRRSRYSNRGKYCQCSIIKLVICIF